MYFLKSKNCQCSNYSDHRGELTALSLYYNATFKKKMSSYRRYTVCVVQQRERRAERREKILSEHLKTIPFTHMPSTSGKDANKKECLNSSCTWFRVSERRLIADEHFEFERHRIRCHEAQKIRMHQKTDRVSILLYFVFM